MTFNFNMRTVMMISIALITAAVTALLARGWLNAQRASLGGNNASAYQILVAKADLSAGHFVKAQDLRWQGWPKGTIAPTYVLQGKRKVEEFDGAVVRRSLVAGQPVTDAHVVRPGEQGFLAAVLTPGKRAVSIQVNAISGISGFVVPGDRVDMVLTHTIPSADRKTSRHVSETVMQDIRVLAVDQKYDDQKTKAVVAKTVTFEVTPKQVEKIGIINKIGKISLSLRPIAREAPPAKSPSLAGTPAPAPAKVTSRPAALAQAAPEHGLSPISSAQAAPTPAEGGPVPLFDARTAGNAAGIEVTTLHIEEETAAEIKAEVERKEQAQAAAEARAAAPPPAPVSLASDGDLVPPRERAGITMDSEVSRVLGHDMGKSGKTVQVMRGGKTEEQKF